MTSLPIPSTRDEAGPYLLAMAEEIEAATDHTEILRLVARTARELSEAFNLSPSSVKRWLLTFQEPLVEESRRWTMAFLTNPMLDPHVMRNDTYFFARRPDILALNPALPFWMASDADFPDFARSVYLSRPPLEAMTEGLRWKDSDLARLRDLIQDLFVSKFADAALPMVTDEWKEWKALLDRWRVAVHRQYDPSSSAGANWRGAADQTVWCLQNVEHKEANHFFSNIARDAWLAERVPEPSGTEILGALGQYIASMHRVSKVFGVALPPHLLEHFIPGSEGE